MQKVKYYEQEDVINNLGPVKNLSLDLNIISRAKILTYCICWKEETSHCKQRQADCRLWFR
jgi:hypothetical protein